MEVEVTVFKKQSSTSKAQRNTAMVTLRVSGCLAWGNAVTSSPRRTRQEPLQDLHDKNLKTYETRTLQDKNLTRQEPYKTRTLRDKNLTRQEPLQDLRDKNFTRQEPLQDLRDKNLTRQEPLQDLRDKNLTRHEPLHDKNLTRQEPHKTRNLTLYWTLLMGASVLAYPSCLSFCLFFLSLFLGWQNPKVITGLLDWLLCVIAHFIKAFMHQSLSISFVLSLGRSTGDLQWATKDLERTCYILRRARVPWWRAWGMSRSWTSYVTRELFSFLSLLDPWVVSP